MTPERHREKQHNGRRQVPYGPFATLLLLNKTSCLWIPLDVGLLHVPEGRVICADQDHFLFPDATKLGILILRCEMLARLTFPDSESSRREECRTQVTVELPESLRNQVRAQLSLPEQEPASLNFL